MARSGNLQDGAGDGGDDSRPGILHLIETGGPGGAERMMLALAQHIQGEYRSVIGLRKPGWLLDQVVSSGMQHALLQPNSLGDMSVAASLIGIVKQHKIRLLHTHEFYMSAIGCLISSVVGIPQIVTIHGRNYYPQKRRRRIAYKFLARRAAAVVAVSADLKRFFCQTTGVGDDCVQVIYNGTPLGGNLTGHANGKLLETLGVSPTSPVIGTVGNLYAVKGQAFLIRALPQVLTSHPEAHLIILGRGPLRDTLLAEAEHLQVQDRVHLVGFQEDVGSWLRAMDIFVLPSLSEGLPLSLLEAMAACVPPVVTAVGGMPEAICDGWTGFIVPPGDPEALAKRIVSLLDDPDAAEAIGTAARNHVVERFGMDRMVEAYMDLYRQALASARVSPRSPKPAVVR